MRGLAQEETKHVCIDHLVFEVGQNSMTTSLLVILICS